ncbi:hypothetical protein ACFQ4C_08990 [Larkinella insperata]|uniref:YD repeat-containing protein n=1 Tax=Larkinella insperata TaxID=332158 RepID=A0ABW3Q2V4_9BACT|nr:hypothetical protein [Larkinella insperata]
MKMRSGFLMCSTAFLLLACGGSDNGEPDPQAETCLVSEVPDAYFDSGSVTVSYDANNRVTAIRQFSFNVFTFTYDGNGRITKFLVGLSQLESLGGEEHTVTHEASGRIATITATDNGQVVTATPTYDSKGRISQIAVADPRGLRTYTKRMEYDEAGNVTKVFYKEGSKAEELRAEYKYDNKKSPFSGQSAFHLIPLISSLTDKSHYLSANNPIQYKDYGYGYTATYQYINDLPTEMSLLLQQTGNPAAVNKQKVYKYNCQ